MFKHNYHAHSNLSRHSTHSLEDSIKKAIEFGFETFSISEHGQLEGFHGSKRIITDDEEVFFINEMKRLKEKYNEQIRILTSFEMDIMHPYTGNDQINFAASKASKPDVDFLIIGCHSYRSGNHVFYFPPKNMDEARDYVEVLKTAIKTGKFLYIAHPDGFLAGMNGEMNDMSRWIAESIINISIEYNIPMGFNLNGIAKNRIYPSLEFWKIAGAKGAKAVFELDSHDDKPFSEEVYQKAQAMAQEAGVHIIEKLDI